MGMVLLKGVLGLISLASVSTSFTRVNSTSYPYSIKEPSTFRHVVLPNGGEQNVDVYAPPIGSAPTALTVYAVRDSGKSPIEYFLSRAGKHVHRSGYVKIMGRRMPLECADFNGYQMKYRQEQVTFRADGYFWRVTVSYELRYHKYRGLMLKMLHSFKAR